MLDHVPDLGHAVHDQAGLVQALLDGDGEAARQVMREHILEFQREILAAFNQKDATASAP